MKDLIKALQDKDYEALKASCFGKVNDALEVFCNRECAIGSPEYDAILESLGKWLEGTINEQFIRRDEVEAILDKAKAANPYGGVDFSGDMAFVDAIEVVRKLLEGGGGK